MSRVPIIGGTKGRAPVQDFNEVNLLEIDSVQEAKVEFWIAKQIGEKLAEVYAQREWGVDVDVRNQMVIIMCPSVSNTKGYHMHMNRDTVHDLQRRAIIAAGEILERHGVSRARIVDPTSFDGMKRDLKDDVVSADSAPEPLH